MLEIAALGGVYVAGTAWREHGLLGPSDGAAPAFELDSLSGARVSLASFAGRAVLLHFWASWCGVCRAGLGEVAAAHRALGADQALVSLVPDDDADAARSLARAEGIAYPVLLATRPVLQAYRVKAFPTDYYVGPDGALRGRGVGLSTRWGLATRVGCAR